MGPFYNLRYLKLKYISPNVVPLAATPETKETCKTVATGAVVAGVAAAVGATAGPAAGMTAAVVGQIGAVGIAGGRELKEEIDKIENLDSNGLNMIANMERNINQIKYDEKTGTILSIPTIRPDVGYGHDINKKPMDSVPDSLSATEAYKLLKKDVDEFEEAIANGINTSLTQDQFNALVGLRYNVGSLGVIDGLLPYLENGIYKRSELKNIINGYYDAIIRNDTKKKKYREGWYRRTETILNIFFDGNYGKMSINAVKGKVIFQ